MDPLALLSDDENCSAGEDSADKEHFAGDEKQSLQPQAKRQRVASPEVDAGRGTHLSFEELTLAGYTPAASLLDSEAYLRDAAGQEARRPCQEQAQAQVDAAAAEAVDAGAAPRSAGSAPLAAAPPPPPVEVEGSGGEALPEPWTSFEGRLPAPLLGPLILRGFTAPTPIQAHTVPLLLSGRDVVGIAPTGSGKTLAYLLPCFARLLKDPGRGVSAGLAWSPSVLALGPTRELVCQIEQEAERFQKLTDIAAVAIYGGAPRAAQLAALRGRPALVVATPGRLADFMSVDQACISAKGIICLILDEADRMLDDGFEPAVRKVALEAALPNRQTAMFSATWPLAVQGLARDFLRNLVQVRVGCGDALRANADVAQDVTFCEEAEKFKVAIALLRGRPHARALVFVATKRTCRELARSIRGSVPGRCEAFHSDRSQEEREAALLAFRDGTARVLVATDVAGRGLDVAGVSLVLNVDPPSSAEDYVHRIGRTGRAGMKGVAITILSQQDGDAARYIMEVMQRTGLPVPPELERRVGPALVADCPAASKTSIMTGWRA